MKVFKARDGRIINPQHHIANFNGKSNNSKGKTLLILDHFSDRYLTSEDIHNYTGVKKNTLQSRLTFWYNIRFVDRKLATNSKGRPCWAYRIAERGQRFINVIMPADIRAAYKKEINEFNAR